MPAIRWAFHCVQLLPLQAPGMFLGGLATGHLARPLPLVDVNDTVTVGVKALAKCFGTLFPLAQDRTGEVLERTGLIAGTQGMKLTDRVQRVAVEDHALSVSVIADPAAQGLEHLRELRGLVVARDEVLGKLDQKMTAAFLAVSELARRRKLTMRDAAYGSILLANRRGSTQVWRIAVDGGEAQAATAGSIEKSAVLRRTSPS